MLQDKDEVLKIKLKSVTKNKLSKVKVLHALRNTESILTQEVQATKAETEFIGLQLEDLKQEISKMKCQISMIGICEVSEKSKIDNHISNLTHYKSGFDQLLLRENEVMEHQKMEIKKREEVGKELERQKMKKIEEENQQQLKDAVTIEKECYAIEQECVVLKKRNKAIMLKLRRKLIESEDLRRQLINTSESKD